MGVVPWILLTGPGASGFSDDLLELTGRRTVPYLIDPNTDVSMFESADIIDYLYDTYGPGRDKVPFVLRGGFASGTAAYGSLVRGMAGATKDPSARPDNQKMKSIVLWGYEASPFVRPVREKLCALALPHRIIYSARGSVHRDELWAKTGRFQVPFIEDPNTGVEMFEGPEIVDYLEQVYTTK